MSEAAEQKPRWGNHARERKGTAIWSTMIRRCGPEIARGHWLDIGCGSGGIAAAIAPNVGSILGVDPEPWEEWRVASEAAPNLSFVQGTFDGIGLPVAENSVDVAVCNQVYEHVSNPAVLVKNIYRALRPSGVCYFAGPNLLWPVEPHVFWPFVHWMPRRGAQALMDFMGSKRSSEFDAYSKTYWQLRRFFYDAGFEYLDAVPTRISVSLALGRFPWLANYIEPLFSRLSRVFIPGYPGFIFILFKPSRRGR